MKFVLLNNANKLIISHFSFLISHFFFFFCPRFQKAVSLSSAGLEHLPYKQRVGGSNPSAPTTKEFQNILGLFFVKYQKITLIAVNWLSPSVLGRLHLGNENKSKFILHFARFALPLQHI